jgi:Domain of unknown function (DUF305)
MPGKTQKRGRGKIGARYSSLCPEVKMALFSRSFVRKRMISLATTASVAATSFALADGPARRDHLGRTMPIQYVADWSNHSEEQPFLSENVAAMNRMMADMTVKPTGDVDRDFVAMMVPHHEGAVDMAKAELKYGHNAQLRQLAQEIVAAQQKEIKAMRNAVGEGLSSGRQSTEQSRTPLSPQPSPMGGSVIPGEMKMSQ